jgi:hypothetical protein
VPLIAGGGHRPTPGIAEAGGTAPKRMGENVATIEAIDRSREVPEMANSSHAPRCKSLTSAFTSHDSSDLFADVDTRLPVAMLILVCLAYGQ